MGCNGLGNVADDSMDVRVDWRDVVLDKLIADINKQYKKTVIIRGKDAKGLNFRRLSTGSLALDIETGGGWAAGKVNELFGPLSSGKTFLALKTVAVNQATYPTANFVWIDFEGMFNRKWAEQIGVDLDRLIIVPSEWMEEGLEIADKFIKSEEVFLIVIDSWAMASPKAEYEADMEDSSMGLRARVGNKFMRKSIPTSDLLSDEMNLGETTLLVINQQYAGIGGYVADETPGGVQLKHRAMIRVRIRRGGKDSRYMNKDGGLLAQESFFEVVKNKTYQALCTGSFWFSVKDNDMYGKAGTISRIDELLVYAKLCGFIQQAGAWYTLPEKYGFEKAIQGETKVVEWLKSLPPEELIGIEQLVTNEILNGVNV